MSEVEKMYENAGVKFIIGVHCKAKTGDGCKSRCSVCDYNTKPKEYPPFTAEKQLSLIKFILGKGVYYDTDKNCQEVWFHYTDDIENASYKPFDEAIAEFINNLWQSLTEQERTEIAEILKG